MYRKDRLTIAGRARWGGVFDAVDGTVIATRTFAQARAAEFRHKRLFTPAIAEGIEEGRYHFFFWDALTRRIELAWVNNQARPTSDALTAFRTSVRIADLSRAA